MPFYAFTHAVVLAAVPGTTIQAADPNFLRKHEDNYE
jgi:hypothetical protein